MGPFSSLKANLRFQVFLEKAPANSHKTPEEGVLTGHIVYDWENQKEIFIPAKKG